MSVAQAEVSDKLTPAQEAYFTSGGSDTSAFETPSPAAPSPAPDAGTPAPGPAADKPAATVAGQSAPAAAPAASGDPAVDEFDEFEREAFDDQGNAKNNGQFIRRANFRVVSGKYKATKTELHAEREARKADQTELTRLREREARLDERLRLATPAPAAATAPAAPGAVAAAPTADIPPPNPEEDIFGYVKWQADQIAKLTTEIGKTQQNVDKTAQTFQETTADQSLRTAYGNDARRFAGENPDFGPAYQHYIAVRHSTLEAAGYADQAERRQIIEQEERDIVKRAFEGQRSPAATIYAIAKQIGYQKPADPTPAPAAAAPVAPAPAAPAVAAPPAPSAVDQVNRLAAAQAASRSLSSGGGSPVIQMSIDTLLAMDDAEFAKYERANPGVVKQLMGG